MNQWPVLFLTLKDVDGDSFEDAYGMLRFVISSVCGEHHYLLDSNRVLEEYFNAYRNSREHLLMLNLLYLS